jgi:polysaccharide pyruvyl transferase WcaK-like protein
LAQGVPAVALSNQEKIIGLYLDLDASDLQFDINNFNPEDVVAAVERLRRGRGRQLLQKVRQHQAKAAQGLSEIVSEIGDICRVTPQ